MQRKIPGSIGYIAICALFSSHPLQAQEDQPLFDPLTSEAMAQYKDAIKDTDKATAAIYEKSGDIVITYRASRAFDVLSLFFELETGADDSWRDTTYTRKAIHDALSDLGHPDCQTCRTADDFEEHNERIIQPMIARLRPIVAANDAQAFYGDDKNVEAYETLQVTAGIYNDAENILTAEYRTMFQRWIMNNHSRIFYLPLEAMNSYSRIELSEKTGEKRFLDDLLLPFFDSALDSDYDRHASDTITKLAKQGVYSGPRLDARSDVVDRALMRQVSYQYVREYELGACDEIWRPERDPRNSSYWALTPRAQTKRVGLSGYDHPLVAYAHMIRSGLKTTRPPERIIAEARERFQGSPTAGVRVLEQYGSNMLNGLESEIECYLSCGLFYYDRDDKNRVLLKLQMSSRDVNIPKSRLEGRVSKQNFGLDQPHPGVNCSTRADGTKKAIFAKFGGDPAYYADYYPDWRVDYIVAEAFEYDRQGNMTIAKFGGPPVAEDLDMRVGDIPAWVQSPDFEWTLIKRYKDGMIHGLTEGKGDGLPGGAMPNRIPESLKQVGLETISYKIPFDRGILHGVGEIVYRRNDNGELITVRYLFENGMGIGLVD